MDLPPNADLIVPFAQEQAYPLGVFASSRSAYFVIVGTSNASTLPTGWMGLASCRR